MACSLLVTRFDSEERLALYKAKAGHTLGWMCSNRFVENNQTLFSNITCRFFWKSSRDVRTPADILCNLTREGGSIHFPGEHKLSHKPAHDYDMRFFMGK